MLAEDVDRLVPAVGRFTSDEPNVGIWCDSCAYRGSPCLAPLAPKRTAATVAVA